MMNMIERARIFATAAHAAVGQKRKYTGDDYIVHPAAVAATVASVTDNEAAIAAAWLHDVVEDTGVGIEVIAAEFGDEVAELVGWLTDVSRPEDGNRAERKAIDRAHTAAAPALAQTIKLADLIDNTASIGAHDPKFWAVYRAEKIALLNVMSKGDPALFARASGQIV